MTIYLLNAQVLGDTFTDVDYITFTRQDENKSIQSFGKQVIYGQFSSPLALSFLRRCGKTNVLHILSITQIKGQSLKYTPLTIWCKLYQFLNNTF